MKRIRFCRNPAPGYWFLLDFPSRKFGKVFISVGKINRWFIQANNNFFGQLPGYLYISLSWGRNNGWRFSRVYEPDEAGVRKCFSWMRA